MEQMSHQRIIYSIRWALDGTDGVSKPSISELVLPHAATLDISSPFGYGPGKIGPSEPVLPYAETLVLSIF